MTTRELVSDNFDSGKNFDVLVNVDLFMDDAIQNNLSAYVHAFSTVHPH